MWLFCVFPPPVDGLSFACASSVLKVSRTPPVIIPNLALKGEDEGPGKQLKCSKHSWMKKGGKLRPPRCSFFKTSQQPFALNFVVLRLSRSVLSRVRSLQMSLGNPGFPSDESPAQRDPLPFVRCHAVTPGAVSGFDLVPTRVSVCSAGE